MVRVSRILKDFRDTGALNSLIALWGFVDDTTFLTKAGAVGVLYRLQGVDFECLDHPQRQAIAHRFEQALRQLDESFRAYQYVLKRPAPVVTAALLVVVDPPRVRVPSVSLLPLRSSVAVTPAALPLTVTFAASGSTLPAPVRSVPALTVVEPV